MTSLLFDLRYGLRLLRKQRTLTTAAVATIAVAIAANTAIFSLIHNVLLRPLPLPRPDRLVRIEEVHEHGRSNVTGATLADLKARARSFAAVGAFRVGSPAFSTGAAPEQVTSAQVSPGYFEALGLAPAAGRLFRDEDFAAGASPTVVISDALWRRALGADPSAVGRRVLVHAVPRDLIGVLPPDTYAPGTPAVWLPRTPAEALPNNRRSHLFVVLARLADTVSIESAQAELASLSHRILEESSNLDPKMRLTAKELHSRLVEDIRPALMLIWIAVSVLLVIAASNVANLLLMQGAVRLRELTVRAALGASRGRLLTQLGIESLILALTGGALGTVVGLWLVNGLAAVVPVSLARFPSQPPNWRVAAFGLSLSVASAVFFGLVAAVRVSRQQPAGALRSRDMSGPSSTPFRMTLVAIEVALTVVLLVAAGLLGRSFLSVVRVDVGFDPSHTMAFDISLPSAKYPDAAAHAVFHETVLDAIGQIPGVVEAAAAGTLPLSGGAATTMVPAGGTTDAVTADVVNASPGYFAALRIPLRRGRLYTAADRAGRAPVMVINEAAAQAFWPSGTDPLGRIVTMQDWGAPYRAQVIGIVGNVRQGGPETAARPAAYYPLAQFPEVTTRESIVIRTSGPAEHVPSAVRERVWSVDRDQPIAAIRSMDDVLSSVTATRRFNLMLVAVFAAGAFGLAGVGIYGVVGFAVRQRTHEIAVRLALGATPWQVIRLSLEQAAIPVGAGVGCGMAAALGVGRTLGGFLVDVRPGDPATLAAVALSIAALAAVASLMPARDALAVDPAVALRSE